MQTYHVCWLSDARDDEFLAVLYIINVLDKQVVADMWCGNIPLYMYTQFMGQD